MAVSCPPDLDFGSKYYSIVNGVCTRDTSFFGGQPVLAQGVGYAVVLGFGAFFAFFTSFLPDAVSKTGLIASVIVSQWTWAATILQSSNVAWEYGVSGPFWFASGATIQVLLFGVMGNKTESTCCSHNLRNRPCEMGYPRPYGVPVLLLPFIHVVLVIFVYLVYAGSNHLGSPSEVYRKLAEISFKNRICTEPTSFSDQACGPVSGNNGGSYLTMLSSGGLVFGIINIIGNFGTVFVDNGY
ncbi:hypothetical protein R1sor_007979 [Riccia sorocarpa]|uniref:Uncharacterized protein n=1 Tax=Riccia sorocarpa TaxID=122646 RepID=A0ABD3HSF3_9MARC